MGMKQLIGGGMVDLLQACVVFTSERHFFSSHGEMVECCDRAFRTTIVVEQRK